MTPITTLAPHQVFVFGSNASGFHGSGAAGYAMRGTASNTWRDDLTFLKAVRAPEGHVDRIGRWAVFGVARGWQQGREGMSYAIETIRRGGEKRSTPLSDIALQLASLFDFAEVHAEWEFLMTPIGSKLAGYTNAEMADTLDHAVWLWDGHPPNVVIPADLYGSR